MTESQQLLAEYLANGSEAAFRELVARYINLVYSTALRLVDGDIHLAEDVTQTVFMHLSRKARKLSQEVMLGGWLHRDTCYVASKAMSRERRRQAREQQATFMNSFQDHSEANLEKVAPILDEAINLLGNEDRTAILLRFFEQRDFRSVGAALGSNEDAARMRVTRALDKLRSTLKRRGIVFSSAALGAALTTEAVMAAPSGLAINVAGTALAGCASGGISATFLKMITMTKLKAGIVGGLFVAGVVAPLVIQHQAQTSLRDNNQSLRQQLDHFAQVAVENERLSNLVLQAQNSASLSNTQLNELLRLRAEVGGLRQQLTRIQQSHPARQGEPSKTATATPELVEENSISKESWAFMGYATPGNALQSVMWAMKSGDVSTFLSSLTPEAQELMAKQFEGKANSEIATILQNEIRGVGALRLDRMRDVSDAEVSFVVHAAETDDGAARTRDEALVKFKNIAGEWRFTGL